MLIFLFLKNIQSIYLLAHKNTGCVPLLSLVEITRAFYEKNKPAIIFFPTNGILTEIIKGKIETIVHAQ